MATVIVVGAGLGGMSAAYELKAELGKEHEVILISDREHFEFTPSNPWIAVEWRERKDITIPIAPYVSKKGIQFIPSGLEKLMPEEKSITLKNGDTLAYDYLVICTGPELAFDEIPGLALMQVVLSVSVHSVMQNIVAIMSVHWSKNLAM